MNRQRYLVVHRSICSSFFSRNSFVLTFLPFVPVDWMSNEPFVEGKGKRLPLPIMGKIPKAYPNYSEILRAQLSGGNFGSVSSLKDKEAEAQISSPGKIGTDERGTESQGLPIESADVMTIDPSASESADPTRHAADAGDSYACVPG